MIKACYVAPTVYAAMKRSKQACAETLHARLSERFHWFVARTDAKTVIAEPKRSWTSRGHSQKGIIVGWIIRTNAAHFRTLRRLNGRFRHRGLLWIPFAQRSKPFRRVRTEKLTMRRLCQFPTLKPGSCRIDTPSMKLRQDVVQLYHQVKVLTRMQCVQGHITCVVLDKTVRAQLLLG